MNETVALLEAAAPVQVELLPVNPLDLPPGFSARGWTFGLPHSNGLTQTIPWWLIGIAGLAVYAVFFRRR